MPRFSAFAPLGMLTFSGEPSHAEAIYAATRSSLGDAYALSKDQHQEAKVYAQSMGLARARYTIERAGRQRNPNKAIELLPQHEEDFGVVPGANDTVVQRQATVAAKFLLSRGAVRENVVDALSRTLGRDFIAYRTLERHEVTEYPQDTVWGSAGHVWGAGSWGSVHPSSFPDPRVPPKFLQLVEPVATLNVPFWAAYANRDRAAATVALEIGDVVVVEPEILSLVERVRVLAVESTNEEQRFQGVFRRGHAPGASVTTMSWPWLTSTQRYALIIVAARAARDPEARRKVNELMARIARGVSLWGIVEPSGPGTVGPFVLGTSEIGTSPFGTFSFIPS